MKRLFKFKYPKLLLLALSIILAYFIFKYPPANDFLSELGNLSYLGIFIAGIFFAFGFSAPFAVGFFLTLNPQNIFLAAIIGGFGALVSDLLIFNFIRFSFQDEFNKLKSKTSLKKLGQKLGKTYGGQMIKSYLIFAFAGILIASPLPDEAGVTMLAGMTKIKQYVLGIISFALNTIGILIILSL